MTAARSGSEFTGRSGSFFAYEGLGSIYWHMVSKLLLAVRSAYFVVLQSLREDHHEAIEHVLVHHRLAIASVRPDHRELRLLGWVRADARRAFACVCDRGPLRVIDVCQSFGWPEPRSRDALHDLATLRLVRPVGDLYHPLPTT